MSRVRTVLFFIVCAYEKDRFEYCLSGGGKRIENWKIIEPRFVLGIVKRISNYKEHSLVTIYVDIRKPSLISFIDAAAVTSRPLKKTTGAAERYPANGR